MQNNRNYCIMKLLNRRKKFLPQLLSLPLVLMGALVLLQMFSVPEEEISSTVSRQFFDKSDLPPLVPAPEKNSDSDGTLRGLLPGNLPPALITRRSGERFSCRLQQDSNTDIVRPIALHIPSIFLKQKTVVPVFEFHTFLQRSLPPRASPRVV